MLALNLGDIPNNNLYSKTPTIPHIYFEHHIPKTYFSKTIYSNSQRFIMNCYVTIIICTTIITFLLGGRSAEEAIAHRFTSGDISGRCV